MIPPPPARKNSIRRALRSSITLVVVVSAAMAVRTGTALAQDQSTIDRLVQLNKKAMDDYDTADFDTAKRSLLDAERLGKRSGLESHPVMARTYVHLGALYLLGFKDKQKAQHYFGKALDIQPDIRLDKNLTSASVRDLFAAVQAQKGGGEAAAADEAPPPPPSRKGHARADVSAPPAPDLSEAPPTAGAQRVARREAPVEAVDNDEDPELPATVTALDCPYPDDAPPGKKVTLRCAAAANLGIAGVSLFYKGYKMSNYESVAMTRSPKGWWQGAIPKKRVDGTSLQFYFEGLDATDKPVVSNGRPESPNVMLIVERGNQAKRGGATSEEEENPLEEKSGEAPKLLLGKFDSSRLGVDKRYGNRRFWFGLGLGSGFIYAINGVVESRVGGTVLPGGGPPDLKPITGGGWAGLGQLAPEIGVQLTPDWAISIEGRDQWIPQSSKVASYTASGAHAVLLKVIRYTKQQRFRMFFAGAAGGGEGARMNIQTDTDRNPQLKDTILVGPVLLGGSAGVTYEISKRFSWIAEVNVLVSPATHKGIVFDLNSGVQANFGDTSGAAEVAKKKRAESVSGSIDDEDPQ